MVQTPLWGAVTKDSASDEHQLVQRQWQQWSDVVKRLLHCFAWPQARWGQPLHILLDHMHLPPYANIAQLELLVNQYGEHVHQYDKGLGVHMAKVGRLQKWGSASHAVMCLQRDCLLKHLFALKLITPEQYKT
eukprot:TRINITY_DN49785_c0_g1_i2.p1 TRINITY_DN49785_c0_g1~~TRINITY_DN49785_c0_g1_i2.p1  ORF type:complete len:133 (-),score=6.67 TRINITY_DN49785_c0_g1_i2:57-455(-)